MKRRLSGSANSIIRTVMFNAMENDVMPDQIKDAVSTPMKKNAAVAKGSIRNNVDTTARLRLLNNIFLLFCSKAQDKYITAAERHKKAKNGPSNTRNSAGTLIKSIESPIPLFYIL